MLMKMPAEGDEEAGQAKEIGSGRHSKGGEGDGVGRKVGKCVGQMDLKLNDRTWQISLMPSRAIDLSERAKEVGPLDVARGS
jgi:hypothetical protein